MRPPGGISRHQPSRTAIAALLVGGLAVASVMTTGHTRASTRANFAPGSAWLASFAPGQLTLVDGSTGDVVDQLSGPELPGVQPGDQFDVVQAGTGAYVVDGRTGTIDRIDGATHRVTSASRFLSPGSQAVSLYPTKRQVFIFDSSTGRVAVADAATLRASTPPLAPETTARAAVLDRQGHLWLVDRKTGRIEVVDGTHLHRTATVVDANDRVDLVLAGGRPTLVDYSAMRPGTQIIDLISGSASRLTCLALPGPDPLAIGGGPTSDQLWVASGRAGLLNQIDPATQRCSSGTVLSSPLAHFGTPTEASRRVFVANKSAGQVLIVDATTRRLASLPVQVLPGGSTWDLFAKDGIMFYNDPATADAGIVRPDGTLIRIRKYGPRPQPGLATSSKHIATPVLGHPNASHTVISPSASAPGIVSTAGPGEGGLAVEPISPPPSGSPPPSVSPPETGNTRRAPPGRLEVTTSILPPATVGESYMEQLAAAGGAPPYTWVESGLPPGLALDHGSGTIRGTPTAADTAATITVAVTDARATAASASLTLVVYPPSASPPQVTRVSPTSGPPGGGNTVTVEGRHLATATAVRFGDTPASALNVESDSSLTVTAPAGTTGTVVAITVTNPSGTSATGPSDEYTYTSPRTPTIAGLSQVEGLAAGGAVIDVTGTNLAAVTTVRFGAVRADSFTVMSNTSLLVTTPAAPPGPVDVTASSRNGTSPLIDADRYTYLADLSATRWMPTPFNAATIAIDNDGDMFMNVSSDAPSGDAVYVETPSGAIRKYAGNGIVGYNGDNIPATEAELNDPSGMAFDAAGNVYIADQFNGRIRRVDRQTGIITTIAGIGTGFSGMRGPAGSAGIGNPVSLVFSRNGDLYFSSRNSQVVCRIAAIDGVVSSASPITIYAGSLAQPTPPLGDGGPATQAHLWMPAGLAIDPAGNLYIADDWDGRIRKVTPPSQGQIITTVAGGGFLDTTPSPRPALAAFLFNPGNLAFDPFGDLYITELNAARVDRLTPSGMIYSVVGGQPGPGDGNPPETAEFAPVTGMAFVPSSVAGAAAGGTLYVCDAFNKRLAVVS